MQSNSKIALGLVMMLGGCAGGGSYGAAPRLADPQFDTPLALSAATPPVVPDYSPDQNEMPAPPVQDEPPPSSAGPRATSGEARYDAVGYAENGGAATGSGTGIAHPSLPTGSFVELTSLATGRTIIAEVTGQAPVGRETLAILSPAAADALGSAEGRVAVRIRLTSPSPEDRMAVRSGGVATRADSPSALLAGLRKRLGGPGVAVATASSRRSTGAGAGYRAPGEAPLAAPRTAPAPVRRAVPSGGGIFVQIAALSDAARARSLASGMDGRVVSGGGFHRVQIGPYADQKMAQQARDGAARRGYGDARIVKAN